MSLLTVFTPALNSAYTLRRLYESLVTQSCPDFEWLVIDNGSSDFTQQLIEGFKREGRIHIAYIRQEHGGP
ncbi:glycosyltransferase family A protein, partial [Duncaniella freteri]|uniref:glycosyltransferase family 2 protein n=2 Tax=Duncaniella TaxID=2518495 RepID=UPI00259FEE70